MEYKEFCEKLIERLREEKGDVFQIEMRTRRMGHTEEEFLTATKHGEKEKIAFDGFCSVSKNNQKRLFS